MRGQIQTYNCPFTCGWTRTWHDSPDYLDRQIDHPFYGKITGRDLVQKDISHHNCQDYREWKRIRQPAMLARRLRREEARNNAAA